MFYQNSERTIWVVTIAIMIIGLVALYSASYENVRVSQKVFFDQLIFSFIGIAIMFLLSRFDYRKFYDVAYIFYLLIIVLLVVVLGVGKHVMGARRWLELGGITFQPSELAKLAVIFALGRYFSARRESFSFDRHDGMRLLFRDLLVPLLLTAIPMLLIFKQPDLGTALLIFGIFLIMVFVSELPYKFLFGLFGFCFASLPFMWQIMKGYQQERLMVFLNPNIDPLGAGYTIIQSKIAIGSGRIFGKGWLSGTQNQLNFLPERHTDFIFSVVGEEWGLLGTLLLLSCFYILIHCGLAIAQQTKDKFGLMVAVGIIAILTLQVLINISMALGLCPVVGLTLPMVSYGRSSFVISMVMLGFLLSLARRRSIF